MESLPSREGNGVLNNEKGSSYSIKSFFCSEKAKQDQSLYKDIRIKDTFHYSLSDSPYNVKTKSSYKNGSRAFETK